MYNPQTVAMRIKDMAQMRNIPINQLLRECELSKNTLSSMLSGGCSPRLDNVYKIAERLDISIDYLVGRTDIPEVNR